MKKPKDLHQHYELAISALKGPTLAQPLTGNTIQNLSSQATRYKDYYNYLQQNKDQALQVICTYGIEQGVLTGSRTLHKLTSKGNNITPTEAKTCLDIAKSLSNLKKELRQAGHNTPTTQPKGTSSAADRL